MVDTLPTRKGRQLHIHCSDSGVVFSVSNRKQRLLRSGLYRCAIMAPMVTNRWKTALWNPISIFWLHSFSIQICVTTSLLCTCKRFSQRSVYKPRNQCKHHSPVLISYLENNSVASVVRKVRHRRLQICTLDRALTKFPFELGIGPICSW